MQSKDAKSKWCHVCQSLERELDFHNIHI